MPLLSYNSETMADSAFAMFWLSNWDDGHCPKFQSWQQNYLLDRMRHDICVTEMYCFFTFSSTAKNFTICGILLCTAHNKKYENRGSFYSTELEVEILLCWLLVLVVKIMKSEVRTINNKEISKSDVWLTVHRNSVWIRKTN